MWRRDSQTTAKSNSEEELGKVIYVLDIKTYYKIILIKACNMWSNDGYIDQYKRNKNLD